MSKPAWLTKGVWGWAFFDFANQAYSIVILTAMFPIYFSEHVVAEGGARGEQIWSACGMVTQVLIMLLSPLLGALADFSGLKKELLFVTYAGCVLLTAALGLIGPGQVAAGSVLFVLSYLFYGAGENFLSAFLPELSKQEDMGRVSAFSWAIAYTGAILALAGAAAIYLLWPGVPGFRLTAVWAAVFFLIAGLPIFVLLPERKTREPLPAGQTLATIGFHRLFMTMRDIGRYRQLFRYLAIMTFFFAGVQLVYWFSGIMTTDHFKFSQEKMLFFLMQVTVTGVIGAALTGRVQDRIGSRTTILICLAYWAIVMLLAGFARSEWLFWVVGNLVGLGLGAIGTATRVMVGLFSPAHKAGEFFGFWGMAHKAAAILGLLCTTVMLGFTDDKGVIIAANAIFFIGGFALMFTIDEKAGREAARRSEEEYQQRIRALALAAPPVVPPESAPG
jgi:MFS transporter, UMF1 family